MSAPSKPPGTVTTGFQAPRSEFQWDRQPIYRIVEVMRDGEGRVRREGRVWHNDLDMLRRFGRAVAANTSSIRVMITDSQGDVIEELPIAQPDARHSAWDTWGGVALPPAPPRKPRPVVVLPKPAPRVDPAWAAPPPAAEAAVATAPRDIPKLPIDQATPDTGTFPPQPSQPSEGLVPEHEATLP